LRRHQTLSAHTSDAPRTNATSGIPNGDLTRALQAGSPSQLLAARLDDVGRSPEITRVPLATVVGMCLSPRCTPSRLSSRPAGRRRYSAHPHPLELDQHHPGNTEL